MDEKNMANEIEDKEIFDDEFDISKNQYVVVGDYDISKKSKVKEFISQNPDKIILLAVALLSAVALIFASVFWLMSSANSVVMFAVFSCCVSCYGFYLSMKNFKE